MSRAEEQALKAYPRTDDAWGDEWQKRVGFVEGYKQALQDLWHNVKYETPIDGELLLLINRNGEYGITMIMRPILYKEFHKWEKWAYIKDLIPSK